LCFYARRRSAKATDHLKCLEIIVAIVDSLFSRSRL
jgi:hypothetical protein